jgi:hypothetical protein
MFIRTGNLKEMFTVFAKELLVTVFVMILYKLEELHFGQESVELFIMGNLLCQEMVGGVPSLKDNAVFGKFQYF